MKTAVTRLSNESLERKERAAETLDFLLTRIRIAAARTSKPDALDVLSRSADRITARLLEVESPIAEAEARLRRDEMLRSLKHKMPPPPPE